MELTLSQIKELTVGALAVTQDPSGIHFLRITPFQKQTYSSILDKWGPRCDYTSGIRLDLHTDATDFAVTVSSPGKYEVLLDGKSAYFKEMPAEETLAISLDGKDHRITLLLPFLAPGSLRSVQLTGETYIRPHTYGKKVAFYGDSITQGSTAIQGSNTYFWRVTQHFDLHSMNFGIGGIRFQPECLEDVGYDPDLVIISLGTNNFGSNRPMELLQTNCPAYFDRMLELYPGKKIVCITPIWRADGDTPKNLGTIHDARRVITEEAQKRDLIIVDGWDLVPHRTELYEDLRLHPNDEGFAYYAENLIQALTHHL